MGDGSKKSKSQRKRLIFVVYTVFILGFLMINSYSQFTVSLIGYF